MEEPTETTPYHCRLDISFELKLAMKGKISQQVLCKAIYDKLIQLPATGNWFLDELVMFAATSFKELALKGEHETCEYNITMELLNLWAKAQFMKNGAVVRNCYLIKS